MSRWFNSAAVEWVVHVAPRDIPPGAAWTLAVVASFTGADGCSAYPSAERVAELTRRSKRQVQRDIDELVKRGLLVPGDPQVVKGLRADRRPDVWDLPLEAREYLDAHPRGDTVSPRTGRQGVTSPGPRGDKDAPHGVTKTSARGDTMSPKKNQKRTRKIAGASAHAASDRADLAQAIAVEHDWSVDHARRVVDGILADSRDVRDPDRFVRWKITQDPSRYRPTPAPPPVAARLHADRCEHGAETGRCALCKAAASPRAS